MSILGALYITGFVILTYVTALFCISLIVKRNDIADIGWGVGILLVGLSVFAYPQEASFHFFLVLLFVFLWAIRLSLRIFLRNIKKGEDARYKKWRGEWGRIFYVRSYVQIYLLQGTLMVLVGYPLIHSAVFGRGLIDEVFAIIGIVVWLVGFIFEVVGDYQLDTFLKNHENKGKLIHSGLWKYSRHPNYFGEVVMWWGIWLMIATTSYGIVAIISPLTITFLILKVSGIPMLEKSMESHPEFEDYKKTTSIFFPLPPKKT